MRDVKETWTIRTARASDLSALAFVESACFPPAEAATEAELGARLAAYPEHFWLLEDGEGRLIGFADGMVSNEPAIRDELFADASLHQETGAWQMIFGVNTLPDYRRRGCAGRLLERILSDAREQGRRGCVLTCKEALLHYYARFGFRNEGLSASVHGGAVWYDMRVEF